MLVKASIGFASLLQLIGSASALPPNQQPLGGHGSKNVQAVRTELKKAEIIPTVVDDFLPSLTLSVIWSDQQAKLGNTVEPKDLKEQPTISLHDATDSIASTQSNMTYIVTLTDPDAPSRDNPKWSEMCHWIATNVSLSQKRVSMLPLPEFGHTPDIHSALPYGSPDDIIEYKPPGPPKKTGKHRYVFLIFAPRNGTTDPLHVSKPDERVHWGTGEERGGVRDWAEENELVPVAANFIYSQNEEQ